MENPTLELIDAALVHLMAVGQTIFIIIWALLPWWKEWIGRALMIKSVALWLLMTVGLIVFWIEQAVGMRGWMEPTMLVTHVFVLIGVWSQVAALAYEKNRAKRDHDEVVGT